MNTYPLLQVDAFSTKALAGNPCAVVFEADSFSDDLMLAIAKEMNLSETAFVMASETCDAKVRYFTPAEEIPLAGHPTIATMHALIETGRLPFIGPPAHYQLELVGGPIGVSVEFGKAGEYLIVMTQRKPQFLAKYDADDVMPAFGLEPSDVLPGFPIQTISTGTPQLMIPIRDHAALKRARVHVEAYTQLRQAGDFFSPHLFCMGGVTEAGETFARHFGVPPDTPEDPFTGSATGGMAAYLYHYGLVGQRFTAEQGHWMKRPGTALVEIDGTRENIEAVRVGGAGVTVMSGELMLDL